jgi:hypothetical protein
MNKFIKIFSVFCLIFIGISLITRFSEITDKGDYTDVAKFFAGDYSAKLRTSHSLLYGFVHAPLLEIFHSFFIMKLMNVILLILIVLSTYIISKKNKRVLILMILSPIIWYLGPWITPISLAALLFLWGLFFIEKFYENPAKSSIRNLIYAGILNGLALAFWDGFMFFLFIFVICFFYRRNVNDVVVFIFSAIVGMLPVLILNQIFYGFAFFSMIKYIISIIVFNAYGSYAGTPSQFVLLNFIAFVLMIPLFIYTFFSKDFFKKNKRKVVFVTLSLLFLLLNPQIRYLLLFWPLIIILLSKSLDKKKFGIQASLFLILSMIIIAPYVIQMNYSTNATQFSSLIANFNNLSILQDKSKLIAEDLKQIAKEYPNQTFVVGNLADDYQRLADMYWGKEVQEFVSIQDYRMFLENNTVLFEKTIDLSPRISERRGIWISGGIGKNENDKTNYSAVSLGIGIDGPIDLENFSLVKKYNLIYISEKPI